MISRLNFLWKSAPFLSLALLNALEYEFKKSEKILTTSSLDLPSLTRAKK